MKILDQKRILDQLRVHFDEMKGRFSVCKVGLFGSYIHNSASQNSDIDLLVDFDDPTFDNYMDLKFYLEGLFDRKVDLVMRDTVKPRLKASIDQDVIYA